MLKPTIKSGADRALMLLAAAVLLAACDLRSGSTATTAPSPTAQAVQSASPSAPSSSARPVLATADGEKTGIRIEVQELKRTSGDTLTLKFVLISDLDESYYVGGGAYCDPEKNDHGTVSGVNLIEGIGKKKYFVVRDTEGACLCSRGLDSSLASKSRLNLWAKFPRRRQA